VTSLPDICASVGRKTKHWTASGKFPTDGGQKPILKSTNQRDLTNENYIQIQSILPPGEGTWKPPGIVKTQ